MLVPNHASAGVYHLESVDQLSKPGQALGGVSVSDDTSLWVRQVRRKQQ